jgi:hypothetical protein
MLLKFALVVASMLGSTTRVAVPQGAHSVDLQWNASTNTDAGIQHNILRGSTTGGAYSQVNSAGIICPTPGGICTYTDTSVLPAVYFYVCEAVDVSGNHSGYSNEASATVRPAAPGRVTVTPQ